MKYRLGGKAGGEVEARAGPEQSCAWSSASLAAAGPRTTARAPNIVRGVERIAGGCGGATRAPIAAQEALVPPVTRANWPARK
ncbi:hypothetical protein [Nocardia sp. NPDC052112]|uniref:hypothetical protein n=1 Tax=Nocardia sp. NPDC052112 TaxID=3155646 RepID=UPI00342F09F9